MNISFANNRPLQHKVWKRLRAYVRTHSFGQPADIDDLTQDVFHHLLQKGALDRLCEQATDEAHFLAMLCTSAKRHMIDCYRKRRALKRQAWQERVYLDADPDNPIDLEAPESNNPRAALCEQELRAIASECQQLVEEEYRRLGKPEIFEVCRPSLEDPRRAKGIQHMASHLGLTRQSVHSHLKRMRHHYRKLVSSRLAEAA